MTCRFELEFKGETYPRSCPDCGFGSCHLWYKQIKKEGGGYELINSDGVNSKGLRIGMDRKPYIPHESSMPIRNGETGPPHGFEVKPLPAYKGLNRVKRAKLADYIDDLTDNSHSEAEINKYVSEVLRIIDED